MLTIAELLARQWSELFKRAPKTTVAVTILVVALASMAIYLGNQRERDAREAERVKNQDYTRQIASLGAVRGESVVSGVWWKREVAHSSGW